MLWDYSVFMDTSLKLIFVYNANSSLFAQLTDYTHKLLKPQTYQCNLCTLTYGNLGMKREWRQFIQTLPYEIQFFHKDEFIRHHQEFNNTDYPAAFMQINNTIKQVITAQEINTKHRLEELKTLVMQKINVR